MLVLTEKLKFFSLEILCISYKYGHCDPEQMGESGGMDCPFKVAKLDYLTEFEFLYIMKSTKPFLHQTKEKKTHVSDGTLFAIVCLFVFYLKACSEQKLLIDIPDGNK